MKHYIGDHALSNGISQRLKRILVILFLSGIFVGFGQSLYAEAPSGQVQATRVEILETPTTLTWESPLLGRSLSCALHRPDSGLAKHPAVVYLKNLPSPRLGQLDDETLIQQFIKQGMMVFEVDYENDPCAVAPELLPELDKWYGFLYETETYPVDKDWIYIVPEGYTVGRNTQITGENAGVFHEHPEQHESHRQEHIDFVAALRRGEIPNDTRFLCESTLTAVMGRESAYTGKHVTWDEILNSDLHLSPPDIAAWDGSIRPVPKPGVPRV